MDPTYINGICVIGMRRTGSNHLFGVLRNFPDLMSGGEFFNRDKVSGIFHLLPDVRAVTGMNWHREIDPVLRTYARANPGSFLDAVEAATARKRQRAYCFKVFEDQLDRTVIESAILARPQMRMVLLTRRALDTYVSLQKAQNSDVWVGRDTSAERVTLDVEAFYNWLEGQRAWYRHWLDWARARGTEAVVLTYEADVDRPLRLVLWRFARTAGQLGIPLRQPLLLRHTGLVRQDRVARIENRIANWSAFAAGLDRLGLSEAAMGYPL